MIQRSTRTEERWQISWISLFLLINREIHKASSGIIISAKVWFISVDKHKLKSLKNSLFLFIWVCKCVYNLYTHTHCKVTRHVYSSLLFFTSSSLNQPHQSKMFVFFSLSRTAVKKCCVSLFLVWNVLDQNLLWGEVKAESWQQVGGTTVAFTATTTPFVLPLITDLSN